MPIPINIRCCHEVIGFGVREDISVNAVAPEHIKTPMHAPEAYEALGGFNPIGRIDETRDTADAILFVDSAPFIIGKILHVGGGQSAGH